MPRPGEDEDDEQGGGGTATATFDPDEFMKTRQPASASSSSFDPDSFMESRKAPSATAKPTPAPKPAVTPQPNALQRFSEVTLGTQHPLDELKKEAGDAVSHPGEFAKSAGEVAGIPRDIWSNPSWENIKKIGGTGIPGLVFGEHGLIKHPIEFGENVTGAHQASEDIKNRNFAALPGDIAGGVTNLAALKVPGEAAGKAVGEVGSKVKQMVAPTTGAPEGSIAKFAKQTKEAAPALRDETNYDANMQTAAKYLAPEQRSKPITTMREAHDAANNAIKGIENKVGEYIDAFPHDQVDTNQAMAEAKRVLAATPRSEAEMAAGVKSLADLKIGDQMSLKDADKLRRRFNADLQGHLDSTGSEKATARQVDPSFAAKEAAAGALRDLVYGKLEERGIADVDQLRRDEGSVIQARDAFHRNIVRSEKTNPPSTMRRLSPLFGILAGETAGHLAGIGPGLGAAAGLGGALIGDAVRSRFTPNPTIERAFSRIGRPDINPSFPAVPDKPEAHALLPPIPKTIPPAADTSGPIRGGEQPMVWTPEMINKVARESAQPPPAVSAAHALEPIGSVGNEQAVGTRGREGTRFSPAGLLPGPIWGQAIPKVGLPPRAGFPARMGMWEGIPNPNAAGPGFEPTPEHIPTIEPAATPRIQHEQEGITPGLLKRLRMRQRRSS